jgi:hypothetical protein
VEKNAPSPTALEASLLDLHASVNRLIRIIQENADTLDRGPEILDKLPLLDFYNDDLLRNIDSIRRP